MATLISSKVDFRTKKITGDKEEHYIMTEQSIHQEVIVILNVDALKNRVSKHMKQKLKREIGNFTIITGDVNTLLSVTDTSIR